MKWNYKISEEFNIYKKTFFEIIENFDSLGEVIFKERNTLRKIENPVLGAIAVKSFRPPHLINRYIYTYLRKSKPYRSYYNAIILLKKGINTPKPMAYFEEKENGKLVNSFYFSEFYSYDFTFRELIEQQNSFANWEKILIAFTNFVFKLHEAEILFKDLSPGNVLIKNTSEGFDFALIDLNRMDFKKLDVNSRLHNFIRLSLTNEMIPIIGKRYAELIKDDKENIIKQLINKNDFYIKKKERKKYIKKLIGKD